MEPPKELSLAEIRKYMLENGCKVTNHSLVKHFRCFLTHPDTQFDARKQFKTYVNILATIKNENNQKYLILRKKYLNECPTEEVAQRAIAAAGSDSTPSSPGGVSIISEGSLTSPFRQPPPYKPPPEVNSLPKLAPMLPVTTGIAVHKENVESYRECVNEFTAAMQRIDPARLARLEPAEKAPITKKAEETAQVEMRPKSVTRENSTEEETNNKENIPRFSFSSGTSVTSADSSSGAEKVSGNEGDLEDNKMSVKEATRKFNRMASEEEAKVLSPPNKKKQEKQLIEEKDVPEVTLAHPKAKEWIVSMAKANYQELAKLANEFPELVKLQDPSTGYTALHWAAKHGNEDVVKLIAGTYKADVNMRTNGGYTPLHLAVQFGRQNIVELLWNVYKANRDLMDWSGNKPLDYSKQRTTVSASTYSSEYKDYFRNSITDFNYYNNNNQYDYNDSPGGGGGGAGGTLGSALKRGKKRTPLQYATISGASGESSLARTQSLMTPSTTARRQRKAPIKSMMIFTNTNENELSVLGNSSNSDSSTNVDNSENAAATPSPSTTRSSANDTTGSSNNERISHYKGSTSAKDNYGTLASARRKESFLRKKLRAVTATTTNKKSKADIVTNQTLLE